MSSGKRIPRAGAMKRRFVRDHALPKLCGKCGHLEHASWCNYQPSICECPGEDG